MSQNLPNVLIVGDSISHGYFPLLAAALNGSVAQLQHAPSNTGTIRTGVECWNITTLLGRDGMLPQPWDLVVFNFGLHDTSEPTPPPTHGGSSESMGLVPDGEVEGASSRATAHAAALDGTDPVANYMHMLQRYTSLVLHSGRVKKGLWATTTLGIECSSC